MAKARTAHNVFPRKYVPCQYKNSFKTKWPKKIGLFCLCWRPHHNIDVFHSNYFMVVGRVTYDSTSMM